MSQMSQEEVQEFNEIFGGLNIDEKSKAKSILANYQMAKQDFCDKWSSIEYNLNRENNARNVNQVRKSTASLILMQMEDQLLESKKA